MEKYYFNSKGNNAPAYSCDRPNDNSGYYYKAEDVENLQRERDELKGSIDLIRERVSTVGIDSGDIELMRKLEKAIEHDS